MKLRVALSVGLLGLVCQTGLGVAPVSASEVAAIYVDGKTGSDANTGSSSSSALKTVHAGLEALYVGGVGWKSHRLEIVGYADYVYHETATSASIYLPGTSTAPVIVEGRGYGGTGYVRPTISGSLVVSTPGQAKWTRPSPTTYPDVWSTPWSTPIPGYESSVLSLRQERVFMDTSQPLVRPATSPTLAQLQATPASEWWDATAKRLYVRLGLWSGSLASTDPNQHAIEIPYYYGLLVGTGSAYVTFRGLNVRHTRMAIGFTGTSNHDTAQSIDASYNYGMGFWTASTYNSFLGISGKRNTIQLVKLDVGAQHDLVDGAVGIENLGQAVKLTGSSTAYNTIRNSTFSDGNNIPMIAGAYGGYVQAVLIQEGAHDNYVYGNTIRAMRRGLYLYQEDSSGGALNANSIHDNLFTGNGTAVYLWDGRSGGNSSGAVTFSHNTYAGNQYAVVAYGGTSHKTFNFETVYDSHPAAGLGAFYLKGANSHLTVTNSILSRTSAYGFRVETGSSLTVTYTDVFGAASGTRSGAVTWGTGNHSVDPRFLSTTPSTSTYLTIDSTSSVYGASSVKGPIGARWL